MELESLNLPVEITRLISDGLGTVGIQLPIFVTQLFLLILSVAAFSYGLMKLRRAGGKDLLTLLITTGFGLFCLGVAFAWGEALLSPLPGQFTGRIDRNDRQDAARFEGMRVQLLNRQGDKVSREAGILDSRNGFFALSYSPIFADPPRILHISAPDCLPENHQLQRSGLLAKTAASISYVCR